MAALLASQMLPYSFGAFTLTFQAHPCSLHWVARFQFDLAFATVSGSPDSLVLRLVAALGLSWVADHWQVAVVAAKAESIAIIRS